MDGELFRYCPYCKEYQKHKYKLHKDKIMFFCDECGNLDVKPIPKELLMEMEKTKILPKEV